MSRGLKGTSRPSATAPSAPPDGPGAADVPCVSEGSLPPVPTATDHPRPSCTGKTAGADRQDVAAAQSTCGRRDENAAAGSCYTNRNVPASGRGRRPDSVAGSLVQLIRGHVYTARITKIRLEGVGVGIGKRRPFTHVLAQTSIMSNPHCANVRASSGQCPTGSVGPGPLPS